MPDGFKLDIFTPGDAEVYLGLLEAAEVPWPLVRMLDEAGIRVVGDVAPLYPDAERVRRIVSGCAGVVGNEPTALRIAGQLGMPVYEPSPGGEVSKPELARFCSALLKDTDRIPPYAYMVGRLERDFSQAREAIKVAVEREAGIPCLWSDDGRHRSNVESVRERTRLLLKHATFVIAELTLGVESPDRENPSRAHEIGMAIAYERKLMLVSQEPRRYPYYSIGDMQMVFWDTEDELEHIVRNWIYACRESVARRVFNYELPIAGCEPKIGAPEFVFDPQQRYIGPRTKKSDAMCLLPR